MTKQLDQLEGKLSGTLLDNLSAEASTASIRISFFDSDNPTVKRTPNASTLKFCIDPENTQGKPSEWIRCVSHSTSNGITTLSTVTRGLQRDHTYDLTGSASRAQSWDASTTPVGVATEPHNMNYIRAMLQEGTEQIPGDIDLAGTLDVDGITTVNDKLQFSDTNTYMDNVAGDMVFKDTNNSLTTLSDLAAGAGTDTKARVSANDTTSGFLNGKLVAGDNITFTENNDGANETLTIASPATTRYAVDSVGTDAYAITLAPALSAYSDGLQIHFEAGTANIDASTLNINSLGAIPIIKNDYFPTITGDIAEDQKVSGLVSVKAVTFTGAFTGGETSGTLSGNWGYKTGVYSVKFSNGNRKDVTLTKGATTATWSGGLSGAATANAEAQWYQMQTPSNLLVGGNNSSLLHYHNFINNSALSLRHYYTMADADATASGGTATSSRGGRSVVLTAASDNAMGIIFIVARQKDANTTLSVHNKNPSFRVHASWAAATAQEGFIGCVNATIAGTSLENSVMTLSHFGFIVEDGTLYISAANGTNQTKTNISATIPSVTAGHIFRAEFDGTTATYYVDDSSVGTIATNVPASNLTSFAGVVIADASAAAKTLYMLSSGWFEHDEA